LIRFDMSEFMEDGFGMEQDGGGQDVRATVEEAIRRHKKTKTEDRRLEKANIEHRTSNIEHRTSNIEYRTPNVEQKRRKKQTEGVVFLSSVRRWMFSVERGASASELGESRRSPNWHSRRQCSMFAFPKRCHARSGGSSLSGLVLSCVLKS